MISVPLAYSLVGFAKDELGVPLAFLLGVFPLQLITSLARRLARKNLGLGEGESGQRESEIQLLQSVDYRIAERLANEDILTNLQLAYSDPVILCIRTNLGFSTIVDLVSQALLWIYLEGETAKTRKFGLRGAQEVIALWRELEGSDAQKKKQAQQILNAVAKELGMSAPLFRNVMSHVAEDPYSEFLWEVWA